MSEDSTVTESSILACHLYLHDSVKILCLGNQSALYLGAGPCSLSLSSLYHLMPAVGIYPYEGLHGCCQGVSCHAQHLAKKEPEFFFPRGTTITLFPKWPITLLGATSFVNIIHIFINPSTSFTVWWPFCSLICCRSQLLYL